MNTVIKNNLAHTTSQNASTHDFLPDWANRFYQAKKVEGVSSFALTFYRQQLGHFLRYCEGQVIERIGQLTPDILRSFLLWHEETGHNPGGLHAAFRVLRAFLLWYENEVEPEGWRNPIGKLKAPKISEEPLDPIDTEYVMKLADTCGHDWFGDRDRAIFLTLLDIGVRARELYSLDLADLDLIAGTLIVK